jgi:hypothetical protein
MFVFLINFYKLSINYPHLQPCDLQINKTKWSMALDLDNTENTLHMALDLENTDNTLRMI